MSNTDPSSSIHFATVSAPTNIACIKYWGKDSIALNTPLNPSVSVTLSQSDLKAVTTAAASPSFPSHRLWLNGKEEDITKNKRVHACLRGVLTLAGDKLDPKTGAILVKKEEWAGMHIHISSYNTFPTAAGLASSAAGYAALVCSLAALVCAQERYPGELTAIARQGSGSACRSMYGGFVAWRKGVKEDASDSIAEQVADERHWGDLRAIIMVVSDEKKGTSSTAGMGTSVDTSALLRYRVKEVVPKRMRDIEEAFRQKDFATFGRITMMDSNEFHAVCLDTYPPIFYMNDVSRSVIRVIHAYNDWAGEIRAAYTFDAGPNAVIYTLDRYSIEICALLLRFYPGEAEGYINRKEVLERVKSVTLDETLVEAVGNTGRVPKSGDVKMIYYTESGPGPQVLNEEDAIIDPRTGLNICP